MNVTAFCKLRHPGDIHPPINYPWVTPLRFTYHSNVMLIKHWTQWRNCEPETVGCNCCCCCCFDEMLPWQQMRFQGSEIDGCLWTDSSHNQLTSLPKNYIHHQHLSLPVSNAQQKVLVNFLLARVQNPTMVVLLYQFKIPLVLYI